MGAPQEIHAPELAAPVDILTPLETSGFWDGVNANTWSERKEAVAELTKLASTESIRPGDFSQVCVTLKKYISDVNIAVSVEALHAVRNLAHGLKTYFNPGCLILLSVLLDKLKVKNHTLAESLTQTLQVILTAGCISLVDVVGKVRTATRNKSPRSRALTLTWVKFCIETSDKGVVAKMLNDYEIIIICCLHDVAPEVRGAASSALAALYKIRTSEAYFKFMKERREAKRGLLRQL